MFGLPVARLGARLVDLAQGVLAEWKDAEDPTKREYATFKIFDRKNAREVETSCSPEYLSNYFVKSDLPWEISPAFFKPEILHRFKADPEKYDLEDRRITCRGAWYLKSYDVNEEGLVHAYIGDLAQLPIVEQRYWQSFNVWPKGTISLRAEKADIHGDWDITYDPLNSLKDAIGQLDAAAPEWWKPRGEDLARAACCTTAVQCFSVRSKSTASCNKPSSKTASTAREKYSMGISTSPANAAC